MRFSLGQYNLAAVTITVTLAGRGAAAAAIPDIHDALEGVKDFFGGQPDSVKSEVKDAASSIVPQLTDLVSRGSRFLRC